MYFSPFFLTKTATSISRPTIAPSIRTLLSSPPAMSKAGINSFSFFTHDTPTDEPDRAGFIKSFSP